MERTRFNESESSDSDETGLQEMKQRLYREIRGRKGSRGKTLTYKLSRTSSIKTKKYCNSLPKIIDTEPRSDPNSPRHRNNKMQVLWKRTPMEVNSADSAVAQKVSINDHVDDMPKSELLLPTPVNDVRQSKATIINKPPKVCHISVCTMSYASDKKDASTSTSNIKTSPRAQKVPPTISSSSSTSSGARFEFSLDLTRSDSSSAGGSDSESVCWEGKSPTENQPTPAATAFLARLNADAYTHYQCFETQLKKNNLTVPLAALISSDDSDSESTSSLSTNAELSECQVDSHVPELEVKTSSHLNNAKSSTSSAATNSSHPFMISSSHDLTHPSNNSMTSLYNKSSSSGNTSSSHFSISFMAIPQSNIRSYNCVSLKSCVQDTPTYEDIHVDYLKHLSNDRVNPAIGTERIARRIPRQMNNDLESISLLPEDVDNHYYYSRIINIFNARMVECAEIKTVPTQRDQEIYLDAQLYSSCERLSSSGERFYSLMETDLNPSIRCGRLSSKDLEHKLCAEYPFKVLSIQNSSSSPSLGTNLAFDLKPLLRCKSEPILSTSSVNLQSNYKLFSYSIIDRNDEPNTSAIKDKYLRRINSNIEHRLIPIPQPLTRSKSCTDLNLIGTWSFLLKPACSDSKWTIAPLQSTSGFSNGSESDCSSVPQSEPIAYVSIPEKLTRKSLSHSFLETIVLETKSSRSSFFTRESHSKSKPKLNGDRFNKKIFRNGYLINTEYYSHLSGISLSGSTGSSNTSFTYRSTLGLEQFSYRKHTCKAPKKSFIWADLCANKEARYTSAYPHWSKGMPRVKGKKSEISYECRGDWVNLYRPQRTAMLGLPFNNINQPDFIVYAEGRSFACYLTVLRYYSIYFNRIWNVHEDILPADCVTKYAFDLILKWMASGNEQKTQVLYRKNIWEVRNACSYLGVSLLEQMCNNMMLCDE